MTRAGDGVGTLITRLVILHSLEDHYSVRGRIWQHALGGRNGVKPCASDRVGGRKLELDHFLSQHGVDICFLSETFLNPGQAFRLANYVCNRTDRPTAGGGIDILIRRGILYHSVPFRA